MPKLTQVEFLAALILAQQLSPEELEKELENYIPAGMFDKLIDSNVQAAIQKFPLLSLDQQRKIAAFGMAGLHMGWILAMKARDNA